MKNHQPNLPHPDFIHKSISKSKYADSVLELDTRVGNLLKKLDELGIADNTIVFYTVDNGAWQDVYPDAGYTPFRGTKGTVREGGNRVPTLVRWPAKVAPGSKSDDILGNLDLMATFAAVAGIDLPKEDRDGQPIIFDSYDMTPVWTGAGKSDRKSWFYLTENELSPGAIRVDNFKTTFAAMTAPSPADSPSIPTLAGRVPTNMSRPCLKCSTSWPTRRSATTSS